MPRVNRSQLGDQLTTDFTMQQTKPKLFELNAKEKKKCMFCGRKEISETLYGLLYQLDDIVVHHFCILLSSESIQNGYDHEGLWGFLLKDIKAELARGSKLTCVHCKKPGATISCRKRSCRKIFHLPCGIENGSMSLYFGKFESFCHLHRKKQTKDIKVLKKSSPTECFLCSEIVLPTALQPPIVVPCCNRKVWFHRQCVQKLALNEGFLFKCPLCRNVRKFKETMLNLGIYIPARDAAWETVPNAFAELEERYNTCDAVECLCTYGLKRNYQQETGQWQIVLCHTCGSMGTHRKCSSLKQEQPWFCTICTNITGATLKREQSADSNGEVQSITDDYPSSSNESLMSETSSQGSMSSSNQVVHSFRNTFSYCAQNYLGVQQSMEQGEQDSNMLIN